MTEREEQPLCEICRSPIESWNRSRNELVCKDCKSELEDVLFAISDFTDRYNPTGDREEISQEIFELLSKVESLGNEFVRERL